MNFDARKCVDRDSLHAMSVFLQKQSLFIKVTDSFFTLDLERRQGGEKKRAVSKKNEEVRR